jgi:hypothetical protein
MNRVAESDWRLFESEIDVSDEKTEEQRNAPQTKEG